MTGVAQPAKDYVILVDESIGLLVPIVCLKFAANQTQNTCHVIKSSTMSHIPYWHHNLVENRGENGVVVDSNESLTGA